MASSYANVTHNSYKLKSKVSKVKIKAASKKESPTTVPYCDTYTSQTGDGIVYICWSDLPCQSSYTVPCENLPGGGSVTISIVYPQ